MEKGKEKKMQLRPPLQPCFFDVYDFVSEFGPKSNEHNKAFDRMLEEDPEFDVNQQSRPVGNSIFLAACINRNLKLMEKIFNLGDRKSVNYNLPNIYGYYPLAVMVIHGMQDFALKLLTQKPGITITPLVLMLAVKHNMPQLIKFLYEKFPALISYWCNLKVEICDFKMTFGDYAITISTKFSKNENKLAQYTVLGLLINEGTPECAAEVFKIEGLEINRPMHLLETAIKLDYSCYDEDGVAYSLVKSFMDFCYSDRFVQRIDITCMILEHPNISINHMDNNFNGCLHHALTRVHLNGVDTARLAASILKREDLNLELKNINNRTALVECVISRMDLKFDFSPVIKVFLDFQKEHVQKWANKIISFNKGKTVHRATIVHILAYSECFEAIDLMIEKGIEFDIKTKDHNGMTIHEIVSDKKTLWFDIYFDGVMDYSSDTNWRKYMDAKHTLGLLGLLHDRINVSQLFVISTLIRSGILRTQQQFQVNDPRISFFGIVKSLPVEIQMLICNYYCGIYKDFISSGEIALNMRKIMSWPLLQE